ncbi:hypothetical protein [Acidipila sp. EB88]|uniref:hypothetical protein n=1 Tax=Acidipila sp. EB88 TaxID=2305226 RepID=UPI000FB1E1EE|nr:hypothetical protein [Acidipila sp. EB88]RRA47617.1 hypothetical protein D1Y84_04220 [Acidipila sp. EB88]
MLKMHVELAWELLRGAFGDSFGDLGTNPLGWAITILSPFLLLTLKFRRESEKASFGSFIKDRKLELKDFALAYLLLWGGVLIFEVFWSQPSKVWKQAATTHPAPTSRTPLPPDGEWYQGVDHQPISATFNSPKGFSGRQLRLPYPPADLETTVYYNGIAQRRALDYSLAGEMVLLHFAVPLGDSIMISYRHY